MIEVYGDILKVYSFYDAICITTNGFVKKDGKAVMGAGVAKLFRDHIPGIDKQLGKHIRKNGNVVGLIGNLNGVPIYSFPTKHIWSQNSDIDLIIQSYQQLSDIVDSHGYNNVVLPRPGCSNGGLDWRFVKFKLLPICNEKIIIISL